MYHPKKIIWLAATIGLAVWPIAINASEDMQSTSLQAEHGPVADTLWLADYAAMVRHNEMAQLAMKEGDFDAAAELWASASEKSESVEGKMGGWLAYFAADAYAKTGNTELALTMLKTAISQGFRSPENILQNNSFKPMLATPTLTQLLVTIQINDQKFRDSRANPNDARLVTEDVSRFWIAYDLAKEVKSKSGKAAIFRKYYLAPATPGLIDYHWLKTLSMERLVEKISESPEYYEGIRRTTLRVKDFEPDIRQAFTRVKSLYPDAYFPDVTFVVGRLNSGGTAGPSGMLIGTDVWSWSEGVSLDGVSSGFQKVVQSLSLDDLPFIVVHEQVHAMQNYTAEPSLLNSALQEGSADFLAMLALPESKRPAHYLWGLENEKSVWAKFQPQMTKKDISNWIGNNHKGSDEWPADLGYFVGARISEAYYAQAEDKEQAIRDLLNMTDPQKILVDSGYAGGRLD